MPASALIYLLHDFLVLRQKQRKKQKATKMVVLLDSRDIKKKKEEESGTERDRKIKKTEQCKERER
jgi:hypothetical protein